MARIGYLYTWDSSKELADYYAGLVPSHRLYGQIELGRMGHSITMFRRPRFIGRFIKNYASWRIFQALALLWKQNSIDVVVCTHESVALPVLALKRLQLIRKPVVLMNIALLEPRNCSSVRHVIWRTCLKSCDAVVSFASAQLPWIVQEFDVNPAILHFVRFGIDTSFFQPVEKSNGTPFFLSAGTNPGKDFITLLDALPQDSKLIIATDRLNMDIIRRHPRHTDIQLKFGLRILELKQLYADAMAIVIPLHETRFSSGQTVLLECMAMGKEVVVAKTSAVQDYIADSIRTFAPGDSQTLREHLIEIEKNPPPVRQEQAQSTRVGCSTEQFASALSKLIAGLLAP